MRYEPVATCNPAVLSLEVKSVEGNVLQSDTCKSASSVDQNTCELKVSEAKLTSIELMEFPSERCTCSASQAEEAEANFSLVAAAYCYGLWVMGDAIVGICRQVTQITYIPCHYRQALNFNLAPNHLPRWDFPEDGGTLCS